MALGDSAWSGMLYRTTRSAAGCYSTAVRDQHRSTSMLALAQLNRFQLHYLHYFWYVINSEVQETPALGIFGYAGDETAIFQRVSHSEITAGLKQGISNR